MHQNIHAIRTKNPTRWLELERMLAKLSDTEYQWLESGLLTDAEKLLREADTERRQADALIMTDLMIEIQNTTGEVNALLNALTDRTGSGPDGMERLSGEDGTYLWRLLRRRAADARNLSARLRLANEYVSLAQPKQPAAVQPRKPAPAVKKTKRKGRVA